MINIIAVFILIVLVSVNSKSSHYSTSSNYLFDEDIVLRF